MHVDATRVERLGARPRQAVRVALASGLLAAVCAGFVGPASASPTWSVSPSQPLTKAHGALSSVACTGTSNCYALGWSNNTAGTKTVVEHWNGKAWSFIASPGGKGSGLVGHLSCPGAKSCWAVGGVFEHWNGAGWTLVPGPAVSGSAPALSSVSCASPTSCTAVGMVSQRSVGFTPLLEQLPDCRLNMLRPDFRKAWQLGVGEQWIGRRGDRLGGDGHAARLPEPGLNRNIPPCQRPRDEQKLWRRNST